MREIAETAGVSRGTLYRYFPSKDHVLAAAAAYDGQRFTDGLDEVLAAADTPEERITSFMAYAFDFIRSHPCRPLFESEPGFVMSYLLDHLPSLRGELVRAARGRPRHGARGGRGHAQQGRVGRRHRPPLRLELDHPRDRRRLARAISQPHSADQFGGDQWTSETETRRRPRAAGTAMPDPLAAMDAAMAANPQPIFKMLRDEMPVLSMDIGSSPGVLLSRKEEIDFALRHTEIFSSNMDAVDLKNKRPMIPLQIDPPDHKKFRKLLDPIFAPRKMAAMDQEVSDLVNHLIDGFIERGEVDFAKEFSVPFPSEVFLTLLGLPMDELDTFLTMKDGIIRPEHVTGTAQGSAKAQAYQQKIADSVYEYFDKVLDEREKEPQGRPACRTS